MGFEASGLVAVLLISLLQIFLTSVGRVAAQSVHYFASLVCSPLPDRLGGPLFYVLATPGMLMDLATEGGYVLLLVFKAAVAYSGPRWRPAHWGDFGEERAGPVLNIVADNLGFALGVRIDGLMLLTGYFTATHLCTMTCGCSTVVLLVRAVLGNNRAESLWSMDAG